MTPANDDGLEELLTRIATLRDCSIGLVETQGFWQTIDGFPCKLRMHEQNSLMILYRTPFQPIPVSQEAVMAGVSAAEQRRLARDFGLDVWASQRKTLSLIWNTDGPVAVLLYHPGTWEHAMVGDLRSGELTR